MITLVNTSKNYSVTRETENYKLSGNATVAVETGLVTNFNGSINTKENSYCGNFSYSENDNGRANKNIYDTDKNNFAEIDALVDASISELKEEINDNE